EFLAEQYRTASNLQARIRLHERFSTNSSGWHRWKEIDGLLRRFDPRAVWGRGQSFFEFTLENGFDQMSPWFADVTLHRYDDALVVTQAEPLVAYVLSGRGRAVLAGGRVAEFSAFVEGERARRGVLRISKDAGLFKCVRRDGP
ncbi:MAG: hypothetical protein HY334_07390, partial [Armatimonadetes bacterium]|nr:hypothetical protein [Armatimonadota bacterium]